MLSDDRLILKTASNFSAQASNQLEQMRYGKTLADLSSCSTSVSLGMVAHTYYCST